MGDSPKNKLHKIRNLKALDAHERRACLILQQPGHREQVAEYQQGRAACDQVVEAWLSPQRKTLDQLHLVPRIVPGEVFAHGGKVRASKAHGAALRGRGVVDGINRAGYGVGHHSPLAFAIAARACRTTASASG